MIIGHTGDWHVTEGPYYVDTAWCLDRIVEDGQRQGVQLWLIGGDLTGTTVPHKATPAERNAVVRIIQAMSEIAPVVIVYGNHDYPGDLDVLGRLSTPTDIEVVDRPRVVSFGHLGGGGLDVFCLPYPQKRWLVANGEENGIGIEGQKQSAEWMLRDIMRGWGAREPGRLAVLLAHINVGGSRVAGGEVMVGREIELSSHDLDELGMDYCALSHIHLHQQMSHTGWYAGSPSAQDFGAVDRKGYIVAECQPGSLPRIQHVPTPSRPMVTVHLEWRQTDGGAAWRWIAGAGMDLDGANVRLRIDVPEEARATCPVGDVEAEIAATGAHAVRVEVRGIPSTRARSEAIRSAETTEQKCLAYWESLGGSAPSAEQQARALARLPELEGGQAAADADQDVETAAEAAEERHA